MSLTVSDRIHKTEKKKIKWKTTRFMFDKL